MASADEDAWTMVSARKTKAATTQALRLDDDEEMRHLPDVDQALLDQWKKQQRTLRAQLIEHDDHASWTLGETSPRYIGGVDISFIKGNEVDACACLVVLEYPSLQVVYEDFEMVKLTLPYIPGFLAFREVGFLVALINKLRAQHPQMLPQVIFVDGNGVLHYRRFGLACHLGVLVDIPTIGIGKNLLYVDGLNSDELDPLFEARLKRAGDSVLLRGKSGQIWGSALRAADSAPNPVFVSVGHKVSLESAVGLTLQVSQFRIPEPVRQADQRSREFLRVHARHLKPKK
eukprot:m.406568 g.406568  ORF g.406568 m.406568 type:complete len:288 (-) comp56497_c0_seq1:74-937(-)